MLDSLDLETTGLPKEENNKTKIIEISLVAVKRDHVLDTRPGCLPRVQHKLTLCLNPRKLVNPGCTLVTGLCNELLEYEPDFDKAVVNIVNGFFDILTKPVCLIAQNGLNFDFPIIKRQYERLNASFPDDVMCADCYHGFYDILEGRKNITEDTVLKTTDAIEKSHIIITNAAETTSEAKIMPSFEGMTALFELENTLSMQIQNERTPVKSLQNGASKLFNRKNSGICKAKRRMPWMDGPKPKESYKLKDIYERLLNRPALEAHRAENDCIMALECSVALGRDFVKWVDENHIPFSEVKPMTIGVPLGLLVLTGVLWGCTNPFIRQGTRGLCKVQSKTRLGQAWAEISFLLGNWRYVVTWLVNQAGSLVYLMAVQRAPLSVAVPTANSLAFAFTAVTGAAVGAEEPLDRGSILGILLIVAGTALCCMDKS